MTSTELVEFNGQVVVISGAATGIGKASAQLIASRGAKVIALDFNKSALEELANELKLAPNQVHTCDISDQNQITATITAILKDHGTIDALINTAGIVGPSNTPAIDVKWADFEKVLQVNLYGAIWLTQAVIPAMKAKKYGRIVHLASIAGKEGNPNASAYSASKAAAEEFCVAYENTYKMPIVVTHTMNVFGERQHPKNTFQCVLKKFVMAKL